MVDRAGLEHPPCLHLQAESGRGGQGFSVCWVGTGHGQTRPDAFIIKIAVTTLSRIRLYKLKLELEM